MDKHDVDDGDWEPTPTWKCLECGEECGTVEETFNYAGTHCNGGRPGTHHTGNYVSDCCLADYEEVL